MIKSNPKRIQHLHWRAGFGLSPSEWLDRTGWTIEKAVDNLFDEARHPEPFGYVKPAFQTKEEIKQLSEKEKQELKKMNRNTNVQLATNWLNRMGNPDKSALLEKMSLLWHGHFACESKMAHFNVKQHNSIRVHALGNFRDLVLAIARDPAMIQYLNNQQNKKQKPNENFARELCELFTIGIGHYTEKDVKEAARAFTGWTTNLRGEFVFRSNWHDFGQKTFLGQTGNFNGEDIIDILLSKRETAAFICEKIYRFFVNDNPHKGRISEMADFFFNSDYDIGALMRYVFLADWFYAEENVGNKIKSPSELVAGLIRTLGVSFETPKTMLFIQRALGQVLLQPPNVAGWPGGKVWIDNATLMVRLNLAGWLVGDAEVNTNLKTDLKGRSFNLKNRKVKAELDIEPLIRTFSVFDKKDRFEAISNYILQIPPGMKESEINSFLNHDGEEAIIASMAIRLMSLPEYQVC